MVWEVILVEEVDEWFMSLDEESIEAVSGAIDYLEAHGPTAGRPIVDRVKGSRYHHMKELRPAGTSIRVLFLFDPQRQAVLLVSGDKAGQWKQWYQQNIPIAEQRYTDWLNTKTGGE